MAITRQRKQSVHHKRAHGQHHKQDHHYLKAYHPYLPLLLLVIVGLAINVFWTSQAKALSAQSSLSSLELLQDTNTARNQNHEPTLTINPELSAAAQSKANDMVSKNYWAHNTPDGHTPWTFVSRSGYAYKLAGENLAYGFQNADGVVTGWLNSPEHRANMLNDEYEEVGFGIASADNYQGHGKTTVVVAMYATPGSSNQPVSAAAGSVDGLDTFASAQPLRTVSRVQMFTGGRAPWSYAFLVALTMLAAAVFIFRHAIAWHKLLVRGEAFVIRHKSLDLVVLSLVLLGIIMSRTAGFIG